LTNLPAKFQQQANTSNSIKKKNKQWFNEKTTSSHFFGNSTFLLVKKITAQYCLAIKCHLYFFFLTWKSRMRTMYVDTRKLINAPDLMLTFQKFQKNKIIVFMSWHIVMKRLYKNLCPNSIVFFTALLDFLESCWSPVSYQVTIVSNC